MKTQLPRPITDEEICAYEADGVICLRNIIDREWIQGLGAAIDTLPGGYDERGFTWPANDTIRDFLFSSALGELAATLMRSLTCGVYVDNVFVKEPNTLASTPWHHDLPYYQMIGKQVCGVWIGIDKSNVENGGMEWIRGSHKWGRLFDPAPFTGPVYEEVPHGRERVPEIDSHREDYDIVSFDTEPGDCIIEHLLVLHSGGPNRTNSRRRAIAWHLYGDDVRFNPIPPARGVEDSRDLGLKKGDRFPPRHELVPQIWPAVPRHEWPCPSGWSPLENAIAVGDFYAFGREESQLPD